MNIIVQGPDQATFAFPDGTDQATMTKAMQEHYGAPKPTPLQTARTKPGLVERVVDAAKSRGAQIAKDYQLETDPKTKSKSTIPFMPGLTMPGGRVGSDILKDVGDVMSLPLRPVERAAGDLTAKLPNLGPDWRGKPYNPRWGEGAINTALMGLGPEAGVLSEAKVAEGVGEAAEAGSNTLKSVTKPQKAHADPAYAKAVAQLKSEDVYLTPGRELGGTWRTIEEAAKSHPDLRQPVVDAERRSVESFNRAAYNRALAPVGLKYDPKAPVGYEGINRVEQALGAVYDKLTPRLKLTPDEQLVDDIHTVKVEASDLPQAQQDQFNAIMNNRVIKRLQTGEMDGKTFKQVESEVGRLAAGYKGSPDFASRELGDRLNDALGALRDGMERSSDPGVRDELKKANAGWAAFVRLQDAAARRATSEGVFTSGDLLQSVKKTDRSVRKGAFARGDALLQDFATTAHKVLKNTIPDSGTALRVNATRPGMAGAVVGSMMGGPVGAAIGAGADMAVRPGVQSLARAYLRRGSTNPKNYLAHATRAVDPLVQHRQPNAALLVPGMAGAAASQQPPSQ